MTNPGQPNAPLMEHAMLRKVIVGLALAGGLALGAFGAVDSAGAQTGGFCSKFDGGALDGWAACPPPQNNIAVSTPPTGGVPASGGYLQLTDLSGGSLACSFDPKYLGNWLQKTSGCGQFCFDFKVTSSGSPQSAITPSFTIYGGGGHATFVANFSIPIGDASWHTKICAPIKDGATPPTSSQGHWVIVGATWNAIITAVTKITLPVDFSSSPSEVVGYDNLCMSPGGCGDGSLSVTKIVSPDPLGIGNTTQFPMTVTCTNPTSSYPLNVHGNTSTVPFNLPVGSICSVMETLPTPPPGCTWLAPVYSPVTVTIASGMNMLTVTNSYTCDHPQEVTGCLKDMKVAVKCNPNGTYTLTLSGGSFTGNVITLTSQTPGVTVTPPQQPWAATTTWTVTGATPGQTVTLIANATQSNSGSVAGTDLCCSAEIKITMPECPKPIDVTIGKENSPAGGSGTWFNVWVTNVGAPITFPAGGITVTDVIPAGMTVTGLAGTGPNWTCLPLIPPPLVGLSTLTCKYNLAGTLAIGQPLLESILVHYTTTGPGPFKNCATVSISPAVGVDTNPANNTACVTVTGTPIDVKIKKTGGTSPFWSVNGYAFHLTVTNVGPPFNGTNVITVTDVVPPGMQYNTATGGPNWDCITLSPPFPIPAGSTLTCTYTGTGPATSGQVLGTINISATATGSPPFPPFTNCATVGLTPASGLVDANPSDNKDCVTVAKPIGSVTVVKKVQNNTAASLSGWQYPVTVTCGPPDGTTTPLNLIEGVPQTVSPITLGSTCTPTEAPLSAPTGGCPAGSVPVWNWPPTYTPPSVFMDGVPPNKTITVTNTLNCGKGGILIVEKKVINNTSGDLTGWTYPMDVDCGGGVITSPSLPDGGSQTVSNIAQGTICSVNENTVAVPANACTGNTVPVWSTTSPAAMIGPLPKTITVQNTLDCTPTPGELNVVKHVVNNTGGTLPPGLTFPVTVTCGAPPQYWPLALTDNVPQTVPGGLPIPSICEVHEVLPPAPAGVCPSGFTAAWSIPVYSQMSVAITTTPTTVTVQNTLSCVQIGAVGNLVVHKTFLNSTGHAMSSSGLTFAVTVACGPPANLNPSFVLAPGGSHTVNNIAHGSICTVTETMPISVPAGVCGPGQAFFWYLPFYTPNYQTVISGPTTTIDIRNEAFCIAVQPIPPPPVCPQGSVRTGTQCIASAVCRPPMVPGPVAGQCICPPKTLLRGGECVKTIECRPPLIPNAAGTDCVCPKGTVQKGRECVRRIECNRPAVPNAAGTACNCPTGMTAVGKSCVQRELRQLPSIRLPGGKPHEKPSGGDKPGAIR